jgi:hypothetical protein
MVILSGRERVVTGPGCRLRGGGSKGAIDGAAEGAQSVRSALACWLLFAWDRREERKKRGKRRKKEKKKRGKILKSENFWGEKWKAIYEFGLKIIFVKERNMPNYK